MEEQTEEDYNTNSQSVHQGVKGDEDGSCDLLSLIQDSQTMVANTSTTLTVVEQSPCKRESVVEMSLKQRMHALDELVKTEESYVQVLALIVDGYIKEIRDPESDIPLPDDLKGGKERMIFGNIEAIYEWHRDTFLKQLQGCVQCPTDLGPLIQKCRPRLRMYVTYCQNIPVSEYIMAEHSEYFGKVRNKLKHMLFLCDLLMRPLQRIMRYELLLRTYLEHTELAGLASEIPSIQKAIKVMKEIPKEANDMMDVARLQKFEGKITAQGKLLLHGPLLCTEVDTKTNNEIPCIKPKELQVFLFQQNIILSKIVGKKTQFTSPAYIYKTHIQTNKMEMIELSDNRFQLRSTDPQRQKLSFVLTTQTEEQYREWVDKILNILQVQHNFLNAIQSPIAYQKEPTKELFNSSQFNPANRPKQTSDNSKKTSTNDNQTFAHKILCRCW